MILPWLAVFRDVQLSTILIPESPGLFCIARYGVFLYRMASMTVMIEKLAKSKEPISDIIKSMGKRTTRKDLKEKIRPGDIILTGRKDVYSRLPESERGKLWQKLFLRTLKPGAGSYTPHGMMALGTRKAKGETKKHIKTVVDQSMNVMVTDLDKALKIADRFVVLRPKKKADRETLRKVLQYAKGKKGAPYGALSVLAQGAGGITSLPKPIRDLYTTEEGKLFCTSFLAKAYENAGENIVAGKARAALAKDLLASDKLEPVGWAGLRVGNAEKFQVETLPKIVAGTALAGIAGATAYGIRKIIQRRGLAGKLISKIR